MSVEIGVTLPTSTPDPDQPILGDVRASARFAEDLGLDSIWATDHLVASAPLLNSTVVLSMAAAVTERITIGFGVLLLALRPVAWAAKEISTLQYLSGDRVVVGVGTGNPAHGDAGWRAAGMSFHDRGDRTDQALRVLPSLITGQVTELDDDLSVALAPGSSMPPVLIAGNGARARRRAAEFGDGWLSIMLTPAQVAEGTAELAELAAQHGRPTPRTTVVAPALSTDPKQGRRPAGRVRRGRHRTSDHRGRAGLEARLHVRRRGATSPVVHEDDPHQRTPQDQRTVRDPEGHRLPARPSRGIAVRRRCRSSRGRCPTKAQHHEKSTA